MSFSLDRLCKDIRLTFPENYTKYFTELYPGSDPAATVLSAEDLSYLLIRLDSAGYDIGGRMTLLQEIIRDAREDARSEKLCAVIAGLPAAIAELVHTATPPEPAAVPATSMDTPPPVSADELCGITAEEFLQFSAFRRENNLHAIGSNIVPELAAQGRLDLLKVAFRLKWTIGQTAFLKAAEYGHLEVLKWLRANVPEQFHAENVCNIAARNGSLDILKYMNAEGLCQNCDVMYTCAAKGGRLDVIQWIIVNNITWNDERIMTLAAENGQDHIVEWMKKMSL